MSCSNVRFLDTLMSVAMWNCHSWLLDVNSNGKLPFLTTRCYEKLPYPLDVSSSLKLSETQCQHWGDISHSLSGYLIQIFWLISDLGHVSVKFMSSGGGVYLTAYLGTSSENLNSHVILVTSSDKVCISDILSGYIWKFELTCDPGHLIWQFMKGYIWPSWASSEKLTCQNDQ